MTFDMWPLADGQKARTVLFLRSLEDFAGQITALRELGEFAATRVTPLDERAFDERMARATSGSFEGLDDNSRVRIASVGLRFMESLQGLSKDDFALALGVPRATVTGHVRVERAQQSLTDLIESYPDIDHAAEFVLNFMDALIATRRVEVMNRAILTAAVSAFEPLVRRLFLEEFRIGAKCH